jgi:hypothetical protein
LGKLEIFKSISNYRVTPIVGAFPSPYPLIPEPGEVSRIFTIPLEWLADPANHEIQYRDIPPYDPWPVIFFKPYDGEVLWGFTARLVIRLLEVLFPDGSATHPK